MNKSRTEQVITGVAVILVVSVTGVAWRTYEGQTENTNTTARVDSELDSHGELLDRLQEKQATMEVIQAETVRILRDSVKLGHDNELNIARLDERLKAASGD